MARQRTGPGDEEPTGAEHEPDEEEGLEDEDFQFALKELLAAYEPVLAEELERARDADRLQKEVREHPPTCEDEFQLAARIFDRFFTEEVAQRLLPVEGREQLGSVEQWRWCLRHIRCCVIFGWLVCRRPWTLRAFSYYLYWYWRCVRRELDAPVGDPPSPEEREDFTTLVRALSQAFRPYLTDQLATVDFPLGIPEDIIEARIDCNEGEEESSAVFERLLTADIAPALLGRKAFEEHRNDPTFWFCRCWCLCAIRFGCCLAHAHTLRDVVGCLKRYRLCLRRCFRPLHCEITKPGENACAEEQYFPGPSVLGVEIVGTATGAFCDHYEIEWKPAGAPDSAYSSLGVVYPGGAPQGACGIVNGTLGYVSTGTAPVDDNVTVRVCVFGTGGQLRCCTVDFEIFRQRVFITSVEGVPTIPGPLNPASELETGATVRSFGTALQVWGHAWVGKCTGREIKRYTLSYAEGFLAPADPGPWTEFWQVDYTTPCQKKATQKGHFDLTSSWLLQESCIAELFGGSCPPDVPLEWCELWPRWWETRPGFPQAFPIDPQAPPLWTAQPLPGVNCSSGKFTLRLSVEDTLAGVYHDTQWIWVDNKAIYGELNGVATIFPDKPPDVLPACATLNLSELPNAGDCTQEWPLGVLGIAYDEYILEGDFSNPSDNFGGFSVGMTRQGGPSMALPVPGPSSPTTVGTSRVGEPGGRCATATPPPPPVGPKAPGMLTVFDARQLDEICAPPGTPANFPLKRGTCCAYYFSMSVWDRSICPSLSGGRHEDSDIWPICICNDLVPPTPPS
jgi:hypothetical protein